MNTTLTTQPKLFEIRDIGTHMIALAVLLEPNCEGREAALIRAAGWATMPGVLLVLNLKGGQAQRCAFDPYDWDNQRIIALHLYIRAHWTALATGDVIDIRTILQNTGIEPV